MLLRQSFEMCNHEVSRQHSNCSERNDCILNFLFNYYMYLSETEIERKKIPYAAPQNVLSGLQRERSDTT